jgi:Polyphosphate kinase
MKVDGCYQFRITRNADLSFDFEEIEDLARALRGSCTRASSVMQYGWKWTAVRPRA